MNKRRYFLFAISGLLVTLCGQARTVKNISKENQVFFLLCEGQKYKISARKKIVVIDLPPNKYFKIEAIDLDNESAYSKRIYAFRVPCITTKPLHFAINETNTVFVIYPKGTPWLNKQQKTT